MHLATWCFVECRGRKIEGTERAQLLGSFVYAIANAACEFLYFNNEYMI